MDADRVVVLADTHLRAETAGRGPARWLPDDVVERLDGAAAVLHAGDIVDQEVLDRLGRWAPVHAVLGNNDDGLAGRLPVTLELELAGVRIGMIHDSGRAAGRPDRLRRRFPDCLVVVFGHSHIPVDQVGLDGQVLFNPGSPTQRRRQPYPTFGELVLGGGRVLERRILAVGPRRDGVSRVSRGGS
ncbi:MAG TPA: metallophosphoesterase family protein [Acidimicrobiales bacterium]|nr:metallophosphoesterase family protein [Acidimicrobiales bacterium]